MKIEEIKTEEMHVLCAPDGSIQVSTLAPDFFSCLGMCELFAHHNISHPLASIFELGFEIIPVKVTILQNGDENKAFKNGKK